MSQQQSRSVRTCSTVAARWVTRAALVVGVDSVLGAGAGAGGGGGLEDEVGAVADGERVSIKEATSFSSVSRF